MKPTSPSRRRIQRDRDSWERNAAPPIGSPVTPPRAPPRPAPAPAPAPPRLSPPCTPRPVPARPPRPPRPSPPRPPPRPRPRPPRLRRRHPAPPRSAENRFRSTPMGSDGGYRGWQDRHSAPWEADQPGWRSGAGRFGTLRAGVGAPRGLSERSRADTPIDGRTRHAPSLGCCRSVSMVGGAAGVNEALAGGDGRARGRRSESLAQQVGVDPKTAGRWLSARADAASRTRVAVAGLVGKRWPTLARAVPSSRPALVPSVGRAGAGRHARLRSYAAAARAGSAPDRGVRAGGAGHRRAAAARRGGADRGAAGSSGRRSCRRDLHRSWSR